MTGSCNANLHITRTRFGQGEESKTLPAVPCPSCMSAPIHSKHCIDFLIAPARDMREQHPWEARRKCEGHPLPGLSGSEARTIGAACTNSKPYGLTQSQDLGLPMVMPMATTDTAVPGCTTTTERCLTKATAETLCYSPLKLPANSGNAY